MTGMLLQKIEDAGVAVLTLTEGIEEGEFSKSRLTRQETCRQLEILGQAAVDITPSARAALPEIDWAAWSRIAETVANDNPQVWQVISELVPATLMWIRVYRNNQPDLFTTIPA
jgi:uncharacterized protein with HEPN domain